MAAWHTKILRLIRLTEYPYTPDERQHDHEDQPAHFGSGAEVMAPEDAEDDPGDQDDQHPDEQL